MSNFLFLVWTLAAATFSGYGVLGAYVNSLRRGVSLKRRRIGNGPSTLSRSANGLRAPIPWLAEPKNGMVKAPSDPALHDGSPDMSRNAASLILMVRENVLEASPDLFLRSYLDVQRDVVQALLDEEDWKGQPENRSIEFAMMALREAQKHLTSSLPAWTDENPNTAQETESIVQACNHFWQLAERVWPDKIKRRSGKSGVSTHRLPIPLPRPLSKAIQNSKRKVLMKKVLNKLLKAIEQYSNTSWNATEVKFLAYKLGAITNVYEDTSRVPLQSAA